MSIPNALSVGDIVPLSVSLTPTGAGLRNFGAAICLGDSPVIDTNERYRLYTSLTGVGGDFGNTTPEYLAAEEFFEQTPAPSILYIGRWASTATVGRLRGGVLSTAQQAIGNFTAVVNGGFTITVDGVVQNIAGVNLSAATTLNGVAALIQAAMAGVTVTWDATNQNFWIKTTATGAAATIGVATAPGGGTDLSALMLLNAATSQYTVQGIVAETIETCVNWFVANSNNWYMLGIANTVAIADSDFVNVAAIIQATGSSSVTRTFFVTTQEGNALSSTSTTDLAALLQQGAYSRTFCQYSSQSPYAAFGAMGIAATVNFAGSDTTITLKFKQIAGLVAESLTETQAATLNAKYCNVYVNYNNGTAILQQGQMSNGYFFDEIQNSDWFQNAAQTAIYNVLYGNPKVPQTDAGINLLVTALNQVFQQAVTNGFMAPGVWNGPAIGQLATGEFLTTGFYVFANSLATQLEATRAQRIAPPIQGAGKTAGAVHFAGVTISVNP